MKGTRTREIQTLEAAEAMAGVGREIDALAERLKAAPQWGPGEILGRLCRTLKVRLGRMEERLERKLVVTIIGPCGAGKSTLLRAITGLVIWEKGIHRGTSEGDITLKGDVVFEQAEKKAAHITPVPGGVGPMTRTMLLENTVLAAEMYG